MVDAVPLRNQHGQFPVCGTRTYEKTYGYLAPASGDLVENGKERQRSGQRDLSSPFFIHGIGLSTSGKWATSTLLGPHNAPQPT